MLCVAVAACGPSTLAHADELPSGAHVISGDIAITSPATDSLLIEQASGTGIVSWDSFSVGHAGTVHFANGAGATLNRVTGPGASQLDGRVTATGSLYLLNPNGVIVGPNGRIEAGGSFVASTLAVDDAEFLNGGDLRFSGSSSASVVNLGRIGSTGGDISLIARRVSNSGTLTAPNGTVGLAAGLEILLRDAAAGGDRLAVSLGAPDAELSEAGAISAAAVELRAAGGNIYALAGNRDGVVAATGVEQRGGRVFLTNPGGGVTISKPTVARKASGDGGSVVINADFVAVGALLDASGRKGGSIDIGAQRLSIAEPILARGTQGSGGSVRLAATGDSLVFPTGIVDASGTTTGGQIRHVTGRTLTHSGQYLALGGSGSGGSIDIGGGAIRLLSPRLDASGANGGSIRIGGEAHGGRGLVEDDLPNALRLAVTDGADIRADALGRHGAGGSIVLWADEKAAVLGSISARPGLASGAGGFIELSSPGSLKVRTSSVAASRPGRAGTILLDPHNVTIDTVLGFDQSVFILGTGYSFPGITTVGVGGDFGSAVSLDGRRLAIGAAGDDGAAGNVTDAGAVYLFSFTDTAMRGGTLAAVIGKGYTGGKNVNVDLAANEQFGWSVSVDSTRLAVGAPGIDFMSGTVRLFSFTDEAFSGGSVYESISGTSGVNERFGYGVALDGGMLAIGVAGDRGVSNSSPYRGAVELWTTDGTTGGTAQVGTIGSGYTGAGDYDVPLTDAPVFGTSVSLDQRRLAVGAPSDRGDGGGTYDAGAVYLFSFADAQFADPTLVSILGKGYSGGLNVDVDLDEWDGFGTGVSLDGLHLAVGIPGDDGWASDIKLNEGAVALFSFTDLAFSGATRTGTIGAGYAGLDDLSLDLKDVEQFGMSVSLSGRRLAVGAPEADAGTVRLFSFDDDVLSAPELTTQLGRDLREYRLVNVDLDEYDAFGLAVSLDGNMLAIGAYGDDGAHDDVEAAGAVYLFTFTDAQFSGGALAGIIGDGYVGGNNIDIDLDPFDYFGLAVSLDANRLAVGTEFGDGAGNAYQDTGDVYLFTFADETFAGGQLQARIGAGYTDGNDISVALAADDAFGYNLSLDGNRLAVGAYGDDGATDASPVAGAVYLFTFADEAFSGATLAAIMGSGYSGGRNISAPIGGSDVFGAAVSLDGNRLAIGAYGDDGATNAVSAAGAVYLYTFTDEEFSGGALQAIIGSGYSGGKNLSVTLGVEDDFGLRLSLDGNRLAVTSYGGDGAGNIAEGSGDAYLFTFTDDAFSGASLAATIGRGYTGGKNINLPQHGGDRLAGISLDGTRLVIGSDRQDGAGYDWTGAAYLFDFTDLAFSGGRIVGSIGREALQLAANVSVPGLASGDLFGMSVSLDGRRLAVGAMGDDGYGDTASAAGAVYLFSFSDDRFSGATLEAILGKGYTGGKNLDVSGLAAAEYFGSAVALDGNRLAVGSLQDNGASGTDSHVGAVYLFTFADAEFGGAAQVATIGKGYTGGLSIDLAMLDAHDTFGSSVSLDGHLLAVGAWGDDGDGNAAPGSGAVYLFSFTDDGFSGGQLQARIGQNYTGTNDLALSALPGSAAFGYAVSLDDHRLAVGSTRTAYLFSFADDSFANLALRRTIGVSYAGTPNFTAPGLDGSDEFGGLSLEGNALAITTDDDGFGDVASSAGAVYLLDFANADFAVPRLRRTIGKGYTGANDIDLGMLEAGDSISAVSLDGGRLAIGAEADDGAGNALAESGVVYLITNVLGTTSGDPAGPTFAQRPGDDYTIAPDDLLALLDTGNNVVIEASNDIDIVRGFVSNPMTGPSGNLSISAGRSLSVWADIRLIDADLTLAANVGAAAGVVDAQRDAGTASLLIADGVSLAAGIGNIGLTLGDGAGNTNTAAGNIVIGPGASLSGQQISIVNAGAESSNAVVFEDGAVLHAASETDAIVIAGDIFTNRAGAGLFDIAGDGRFLVYSDTWTGMTRGGLGGANLYGVTYDPEDPFGAAETGSYFVFASRPTLSISGTAASPTYDGNVHALSGYTVTGLVNDDAEADALTTLPIFGTFTAAGTYTTGLLSGGASAIGYIIEITSQGVLTIGKRSLGVAADTGQGKTYGETDTTPYAYSIISGSLVSEDVLIGAITRSSGQNAGSYDFLIGSLAVADGNDGGNYELSFDGTTNPYLIGKRSLSVAADAGQSKIYGETDPTPYAYSILTGSLAGEDGFTGAITRSSGENAGSYDFLIGALAIDDGNSGGNYTLSFDGTTNRFAIDRRALAITALDELAVYSGTPYAGGNGILFAGFAPGEGPGDLNGVLTYGGTAQGATALGSYTILPGGFTSANYDIAFAAGTLVIADAPPPASYPPAPDRSPKPRLALADGAICLAFRDVFAARCETVSLDLPAMLGGNEP